jgi:hypothetical protein
MRKDFYPDIEFNRKRRSKLVILYVLMALFPGGFSIYLFASGQVTTGVLLLAVIFFLLTMIPTSLSQYPVKKEPLISIDGKMVYFGKNETLKAADILAVSVCIEVPVVSKKSEENKAYLERVAATKPKVPILGACDVSYRDAKGKEQVKYTIVEDCLGALEEFLAIGVKKYRILYSQKKLTAEAKYPMTSGASGETKLSDLSEREKMEQLF